MSYWIVPTDAGFDEGSENFFRRLVIDRDLFGFRRQRPLKIGDRLCFYSAGNIIADARVASAVREDSSIINPLYPFAFDIDTVHFYMENPIKFDSIIRRKLDAFSGRKTNVMWSWFVRMPHIVTKHDFEVLTAHSS